jgi:hypothetical protein
VELLSLIEKRGQMAGAGNGRTYECSGLLNRCDTLTRLAIDAILMLSAYDNMCGKPILSPEAWRRYSTCIEKRQKLAVDGGLHFE